MGIRLNLSGLSVVDTSKAPEPPPVTLDIVFDAIKSIERRLESIERMVRDTPFEVEKALGAGYDLDAELKVLELETSGLDDEIEKALSSDDDESDEGGKGDDPAPASGGDTNDDADEEGEGVEVEKALGADEDDDDSSGPPEPPPAGGDDDEEEEDEEDEDGDDDEEDGGE